MLAAPGQQRKDKCAAKALDLARMPLFTALLAARRAPAAAEQFGFSSHASADAVAAPQESSSTNQCPWTATSHASY